MYYLIQFLSQESSYSLFVKMSARTVIWRHERGWESISKLAHSQGSCGEASVPRHMGLSTWLLTAPSLSFLRASGPWESHRVFLWASLGSDKPSLLPYSIGHTSNSDTIWEKWHKGKNTSRQMVAFLDLGYKQTDIMVDVVLHMSTNSLIPLSLKGK